MSVILKALKKSEEERKLAAATPGQSLSFHESEGGNRSLSRILGAILILNIVVWLGFWYLQAPGEQKPVSEQAWAAGTPPESHFEEDPLGAGVPQVAPDDALEKQEQPSIQQNNPAKQTSALTPQVVKEPLPGSEPAIPASSTPPRSEGDGPSLPDGAPLSNKTIASQPQKPEAQSAAVRKVRTSGEHKKTSTGVPPITEVHEVSSNPIVAPGETPAIAALPLEEVSGQLAALAPVKGEEEDTPYASVPHYHQLPRDFRLQMPEIEFSVHIFDPNPKRRSVRINRQKFREGEEVEKDLVLLAVQTDGIVMRFRETRFWLDRP